MSSVVPERDRAAVQVELARYLQGDGVELGPGHSPYPLPYPGVTVRYVDRWEPESNRALFPELEGAEFPRPDVVANLDTDRLSAFDDASQDFVIASHVLEHMANPLALIGEIWRVLRPGGVTLILMPDRRRTFDHTREPTPLDHLVGEYRTDVHDVGDDHIEDFLRGIGEWDESWDVAERARQYALHRERSIHVHCWDEREFFDVIRFTVSDMDQRWELLEALFVEDVAQSIEFGYVLRKPVLPRDGVLCLQRLDAVWKILSEHSANRAAYEAALQAAATIRSEADAVPPRTIRHFRDRWDSFVDWLRRSPLAPVLRAGRNAVRRLLGRSTSASG
jgi:SAM-dependent methyltransferase